MYTHYISLKFLSCLALSLFLAAPGLATASKFEALVMPGKLIKGHEKYEDDCSQCHSNFSKQHQTSLCADCHKDIKSDLASKQGFHGRNPHAIKQDCKQCHTDHKGRNANIIILDKETFNHQQTDFNLKGKHNQVQCTACHKAEKKYRDTETKCYSCHQKADPHDTKLGKECGNCHNENSWKKISFDHDKTKFALKGKHKDAICQSCHPDNRHKNTPKECVSCHALDDTHHTRYGNKCETCHIAEDWKKASFDHDKKTKYPLKGRHKNARCDACHTGTSNIYKKKPETECISCHKADDTHKGKNGEKCQSCHSPASWKKSSFSHNKDTKFPLKGKHEKLSCTTCHQGNMQKNKLKTDCLSCHKIDDTHNGQQGKQCQTCHNEHGWNKRITFNHDLSTFPLIGQHAISACEQCHITKRFKDAKTDCITCHAHDDEHTKTLGDKCHTCHNPNSWSLWLFDHNKQTKFALDGAHKNLKCSNCHTTQSNGDIEKSSTCATCHYQDDIHRGGFGKNCEQCHNTSKFSELTL